MAVFNCKMCGGSLQISPDNSIAICEYCGSKQTLPHINDEKIERLYERANALRRNNDFDKAMAIYEMILLESPKDAEAYWSLVLCRYGVEYVVSPQTGQRVPTIHRAQHVSILADSNYLEALNYADPAQRSIYETEAAAINSIQEQFLTISQREEPFDVFICYKEKGLDGNPTLDAVRASELYHELTREGIKTFYAPVTLEDKLGEAYEPYIFAALNSAKVMVIIGTRPEHLEATWVKNEWSRFLKMKENGEKKEIIVAYENMSPYDVPERIPKNQMLNMTKLGFMLDLIRGIKKFLGADQPIFQPAATPAAAARPRADVDPLVKRVQAFLANEEWTNAEIYCEKILDVDPESPVGHLYKLLTNLKVTSISGLESLNVPLDQSPYYRDAVRYADEETTTLLITTNNAIAERIEKAERTQRQYQEEQAQKEQAYQKLLEARENTINVVKNQTSACEQLSARLIQMNQALGNGTKYRTTVLTWAFITMGLALTALVSLATYEGRPSEVPVFSFAWVALLVTAGNLAKVRGKSALGAVFLTLFTMFIYPLIASFIAMASVNKAKEANLVNQRNQVQAELQNMQNSLNQSRQALNNFNQQIQNFH